MAHELDPLAKRLFQQAILEDRCGELLACLFDGGAATIDASTGKLAMIGADGILQLEGRTIDHDERA